MKKLLKSDIFLGIFFIIFAIAFSELIVHIQLINFWKKEHYEVGYSLGFWTPLITASIVIHLLLYIKYQHEKKLKEQSLLLEKLTITDALTGLYNRRHFNNIVPCCINSSKRNNSLISLVILDIDYFKQYNDSLGHIAGDEALIKVSKCLKDSMKRSDDFCFRIGGEEFAILFKVNSHENALQHVNKIKSNINNLKIHHPKSPIASYITISMGLTCTYATEITSTDELLKQTDDLLYKAKENGRNRVEHI